MISYDVNPLPPLVCKELRELSSKEGTDWQFKQEDVLLNTIEETDLLFIDTLHTYKQLKLELYRHAHKAKQFLVFHDTTTFGYRDENVLQLNPNWDASQKHLFEHLPDKQGLMPAISEFLQTYKCWTIKAKYENNNGLLILERK
jgi:hypothetical protein